VAAGKRGSPSAVFLVGGYNLLAMKLKELRHKIAQITEQSEGLGSSNEAHTPVGVSEVTIAQAGGFFDTATNSSHAALSAGMGSTPQASPRIICVGFSGNAKGEPIFCLQGQFQTTYEVMAAAKELTKANADYRAAGQLDRGVIVQELAAKTADWNTKTDGAQLDYTLQGDQLVVPITSASKAANCVVTTTVPHGYTTGQIIWIAGNSLTGTVINGQRTVTVIDTTSFSIAVNTSGSGGAGTGGTVVKANSLNGAVGYLQVTDFSGFSQAVIKLRDSSDDVTYADLMTFTTVTSAPTADRQTVAGVVDRYMSVDGDITGSGSITALVAIARNA